MPTYTVRLSDGSTQTIDSAGPPQLGAPLTAPVQGGLSPQIPTVGQGIPSLVGSSGGVGSLRPAGKPMTASDTLSYAQALGVAPTQVPAAIAAGVNPAAIQAQSDVTKETAKTQATLAPRLRSIVGSIPRMEAASARVNTESSYYSQLKKYGPFAGLRGKSPDIAELNTYRAMRASLARLTGDVGNLSETEQKTVEDAFIPLWYDSQQVAQQKIKAIKNFIQDIQTSGAPDELMREIAGIENSEAIRDLYTNSVEQTQAPATPQAPQPAPQTSQGFNVPGLASLLGR